jgi:peroxiredoxin
MSAPFIASYASLWVLVIGQTLILLGLVRAVYRLQVARPLSVGAGSAIGVEVPRFMANDIDGRTVDSSEFNGSARAFLFVTPHCPSCTVSLDEMAGLEFRASGDVIVVCQGRADNCSSLALEHQLGGTVLVDESGVVSSLFDVTAVPTAVLVDENDRITRYGSPHRDEADRPDSSEEESVESMVQAR